MWVDFYKFKDLKIGVNFIQTLEIVNILQQFLSYKEGMLEVVLLLTKNKYTHLKLPREQKKLFLSCNMFFVIAVI